MLLEVRSRLTRRPLRRRSSLIVVAFCLTCPLTIAYLNSAKSYLSVSPRLSTQLSRKHSSRCCGYMHEGYVLDDDVVGAF